MQAGSRGSATRSAYLDANMDPAAIPSQSFLVAWQLAAAPPSESITAAACKKNNNVGA
jgi:hypothetical protein